MTLIQWFRNVIKQANSLSFTSVIVFQTIGYSTFLHYPELPIGILRRFYLFMFLINATILGTILKMILSKYINFNNNIAEQQQDQNQALQQQIDQALQQQINQALAQQEEQAINQALAEQAIIQEQQAQQEPRDRVLRTIM